MSAPIAPAEPNTAPSLDEKKVVEEAEVEAIPLEQPKFTFLSPIRWRAWERWRNDGPPDEDLPEQPPLGPLPEEERKKGLSEAWRVVWKFVRFMGPGALISVAYIDPDNYQTNIQAGQDFQFELLFMIWVSNVIAIYLQYLALKLGTVTGLDLAQMNNRHLPRWLELIIYFVAEACIICTDVSQVVGTAFAWSLLIPQLPLVWACVLTVADTLLILLFYSPTGQLRRIRLFEVFVAGLVIAVFITVCIALSQVTAPAGPVFRGFLPCRDIFVSQGLYTSCAILGGTLMPHALYVGSAVARPRLLEYDIKYRITSFKEANAASPNDGTDAFYRPSLRAIRSCLKYSVWELALTIFIVAVFVNSALVIVAGAAFYGSDDFSDLYSLYDLFQSSISDSAAVIFAVSLLFSGVSAGIVATMAGQTVMEAAWRIRVHPFWRRLITRCVAIIPALIICTADGENGMAEALVACNYVLAIGLVFVTLPLVWYVTHDRYMRVPDDEGTAGTGTVSFSSGIISSIFAWFIWALVIFMDIATIVLLGLGLSD